MTSRSFWDHREFLSDLRGSGEVYEVVIKEKTTSAEKKVVVDPKEIATLKQGDKVKVILKEGTNTAEKIKVYAAKKKAAQ